MTLIQKKNIVVFASGTGSNFISIYNNVKQANINGRIVLLVSNNPRCKAVNFANSNDIKTCIISKDTIANENSHKAFLLNELKVVRTDLIVLAGYLKIIPLKVISHYRNKILNIHPSLLPKFGGKGFYGMKVHKAVMESNELFTGATVHFVDEIYDNGPIVAQERIEINQNDDIYSISKRVLEVEHSLLPYIVKKFCKDEIVFKEERPVLIGEG